MKRILFFAIGLLLSFSAQSAVIFQSAAYGSNQAPVNSYCSNCSYAADQYIGETFSITTTSLISSLDFYAQLGLAGSGDLTIGFYDAPESLVYFQNFSLAEQTKTDIDAYTTNISVNFSPFQLEAGNYAVFFFGQDLGLNAYSGFGTTQLFVRPSGGVLASNPLTTESSSAIRLSGTTTAVPEPEAFAMLSLGLVAVTAYSRRRKQNA